MKKTLLALALAVTAFSASAACSVTDTTQNAVDCYSFSGNDIGDGGKSGGGLTTTLANLAVISFGADWSLVDVSGPGSTLFTSAPETENGRLTFSQPLTGEWALTLKAGKGYNAYLFAFAGDTFVDYTLSKELSHAALWKTDAGTFGAPPPIPEPSTYALLLAGLGLVGFVAHRRKST